MNRTPALVLLASICVIVQAQQSPTFRSESRVVLVDAIVTDKHGGYVRDLTKDDFRLWEDDEEQKISNLTFHPGVSSQKTYTVLFFDDANTPLDNRRDARQAADRFLDRSGEDRMIAVAEYGQSLRIAQNFTGDSAVLKSVLHRQRAPDAGVTGGTSVLLALRRLANDLADIPGRKTVIFLSAGFPLPAPLEGELTAAFAACNRSGVAVYPIDLRGIQRTKATADAATNRNLMTPANNGAAIMPNGGVNRNPGIVGTPPQVGSPYASADTPQVLRSIAKATGGFFIHDPGDLPALDRLGQEQHEYYLLGYTPSKELVPGTCHTLKVRVVRTGSEVRARSGYCDRKPLDLLSGSAVEKALEDRAAGVAQATVAASMACPFFYIAPDLARVHAVIEIPASALKFTREKGRYRAEANVLGIAYLPDGGVAARFSDTASLEFSDEKQLNTFRSGSWRYEKEFKIAAGNYTLKVTFSTGGEGFGKPESPLNIEPWDGRSTALSSLAFGTRVHSTKDAAEGLNNLLSDDRTPLTAGTTTIEPSGTSRFRLSDQVYVYAELYGKGNGVARIELLNPKTSAPEQNLGDVAVTESRILFALRMASLSPGAHRLRVFFTDGTGMVYKRDLDFELGR